MVTTVGTKGQVVIDKAIRDQLGIAPGWRAYQTLEEGHVKIYFRPPPHNRSLLGVLREHIPPEAAERFLRMTWSEIEEEAWDAIAEDRASKLGIGPDE